jgi:hypothetical protein
MVLVQARQILVRKNGTFSVRGTENIRMVLDPTELLGRDTGKLLELTKLSQLKVEKLA